MTKWLLKYLVRKIAEVCHGSRGKARGKGNKSRSMFTQQYKASFPSRIGMSLVFKGQPRTWEA